MRTWLQVPFEPPMRTKMSGTFALVPSQPVTPTYTQKLSWH
jgi:hypothetical protein